MDPTSFCRTWAKCKYDFIFHCCLITLLLLHLTLCEKVQVVSSECDLCGVAKCKRHQVVPEREPWKGLLIDNDLDKAIDSVRFVNFFSISIYLINLLFSFTQRSLHVSWKVGFHYCLKMKISSIL